MSYAWGPWQCPYNWKDWRGGVNAWVLSETATTATIRVEARYNSPYARQVNTTYAYTSCDGANSGWVSTGGLNQPSNVDTTLVRRTQDFTVSKGASGRNVWCAAGVQIGGTYSPGTSEAGVNVWVNAVTVSAPDAPTGASATKNSDYSATIRWANHPSGATKPYSNLYVERQTDSGGWTQVAELGGTATSYTDSKITTSHTYRWRVRARNSAGYSGYATTGAVTTSHVPNAPTSCSASRASDSQAKVTWKNAPATDRPYSGVNIERQTDEGSWVQLSALGAVTNYTDNAISGNRRYRYRVRARNNAGYSGYATSSYIYTTPAAPSSVTLSKTSAAVVSVDISGKAPWASSYEVQYRVNGGSWQTASDSVTSWPFSHSPGAGTVRYRVRAKRASLYSGWRESGDLTTIAPPLAPSVSVGKQVFASGETVTVSWVRNHPDGSEQSSAEVEITGPGTDGDVREVAGSASALALTGLADGSWSARVRTHGLYDGWGEWSSPVAWRVATRPSVAITNPAIDGDVVSAVPFSVTWEAVDETGISEQVVTLMDSAGSVLHEVRLGPDARSYEFSAQTYLPRNLEPYIVRVAITGGSSLSSSQSRIFSADYAEPARPAVEVTYDEGLAANVLVRHGFAGWQLEGTVLVSPEETVTDEGVVIAGGITETETDGILAIGDVLGTVSVSVSRLLLDGSQWLVEGDLGDGQSARDPLPPLNTDYTYMVTSYSEVGTATTVEVPARVDAHGMEAFNFGDAAEVPFVIGLDASASDSYGFSGETFRFAMGEGAEPLPTFYPDGDIDVTGSRSYVLTEDGEFVRLRSLLRDPSSAVCWFRDHFGGRHRVTASWGTGYDAKRYGTLTVDVDMTEVVFEEAYHA